MSTNKKIISFLILFLSFFGLSLNVFADTCDNYGCATCVYENSTWKWKYVIKSTGNGTAEARFSYELKGDWTAASAAYAPKLTSEDLVAKNFIDTKTNKILCPAQVYLLYSGASAEIFGEPKEVSWKEKTVAIDLMSESTNNNLTIGETLSNSCSRECPIIQSQNTVKVTVTPVGDELKFELSDGFKINTNSNGYDLTVKDFQNACPEFFCQCGSYGDDKYCSLSLTQHFDVLERDEAQQSHEELEAGNNNNNTDVKYESIPDDTIVGENFCAEESTQRVLTLVGYILIIVKILVPLILIVIGTIDLFQAVMGKDEKALTKGIKSLVLRLLLGVFIFFVPTIVNYVFDLVNEINGDNTNVSCVTCVLDPGSCE